MFISISRKVATGVPFMDDEVQELEVIPGRCIYTNPMEGIPKGVFMAWDYLTDDQRLKFQEVHAELTRAAIKLQGLFLEEFQGREDTLAG